MQLRKLSFIEKIAQVCLSQFPLFVMLVIYTTAPTYFYGWYDYKTYIFFVFPQVVLPSMLLCLLASWRRWAWWLVFIICNLAWMIELGCLFCQHQRLWSWVALMIAQSNPGESAEYLSTVSVKIIETIMAAIVSAVMFYILDRLWRSRAVDRVGKCYGRRGRAAMRCAGLLLLLSVIYSPVAIYKIAIRDKDYHSRINCFMQVNAASTWIMYAYALNDVFNSPYVKAIPQLIDTLAATEVTLVSPPDSLDIVYVIGESFSRNRSSLYGYPVETNPMMTRLLADSSLIIFDNVISHCQFTSIIFRTLLSTYDRQGDREFESFPLLPALMKKAGYDVSYYDNQKAIADGRADWTFSYFFTEEKIREYCLDTYNDKEERYDADLVNKYPPAGSSDKNFTIYHLMGQHNDYDKRFPADFGKFTKDDYRRFEGLSEEGAAKAAKYDNASLYNDYTLHAIIERLRDKTAILVYVPDHGEEVYDYREVAGRSAEAPLASVRMYYEVPVMIWVSDSFRQKYPGKVSALRNHKDKAIYNSDLSHTFLDIAGIRTATFNPDVSLLRDGVGRTHRHVQMYDIDYDASRDEIYRQKFYYDIAD